MGLPGVFAASKSGLSSESKAKADDIRSRLELGHNIVRWEYSPELLETQFLLSIKPILDKLEESSANEELVAALKAAGAKIVDKIVSKGRLHEEMAAHYATHFSKSELEELFELIQRPVIRKRDLKKSIFGPVFREAVRRDAAAEEREVFLLLGDARKILETKKR